MVHTQVLLCKRWRLCESFSFFPFAYWVITSAWDLQEPFGPDAEWKGIKTPAELKAKLPQSYALFERTIPKVMAAPSREHLTKLYGN